MLKINNEQLYRIERKAKLKCLYNLKKNNFIRVFPHLFMFTYMQSEKKNSKI